MMPATKRQTWMLFCLTHEDWRSKNLSKEEASIRIRNLLKAKNEYLDQTKEIIREAALKADKAAEIQYRKLVKRGPIWNVIDADPLTGREKKNPLNRYKNGKQKPGWQLLDACGFATIVIYNSQKFCNALKKIAIKKDKEYWEGKGWTLYKNYKSGYGLALEYHLSKRQEISIHEAAMSAALTVLKNNGVKCYINSRLN